MLILIDLNFKDVEKKIVKGPKTKTSNIQDLNVIGASEIYDPS